MATETPARGSRGQDWRGWCLKSTERCPSRCVRVKVHQRARRLKFLCLGMPCVALISRPKIQPLRLNIKLKQILHPAFRAPVLLVGVKLVRSEGRIMNLVQYSGIKIPVSFVGVAWMWIKVDHGDSQIRSHIRLTR